MNAHDAARYRLIDALDRIETMATESVARNEAIRDRAAWLRDRLAHDAPLEDIMRAEPGPLIVELMTANLAVLQDVGAELRAAQAETLRAEGLTMEMIADLFGVTRQRVSALLRSNAQRRGEDPSTASG